MPDRLIAVGVDGALGALALSLHAEAYDTAAASTNGFQTTLPPYAGRMPSMLI